jgi:hypothetical protein
MNYIIDIIDTKNEAVLALEKAVKSSIVLDWKGGDLKDELDVIGSSLAFTMVGMSCEDGQFIDLFTGDETRFKVRLSNENDITIWTGFLLPDQYSEPYHDSPILIDFLATDGLGRIKGKYLPDDYYEDEKSVIQILAKCLELTNLKLDFRFSPAIENTQQKDYNLIYIDTALYIKDKKKKNAHEILKELLTSMLCVAYQADNYWNIEGINVRENRVYTTKVYNYLGNYKRTDEVTRLQKDITGIATPQITVRPPYGIIELTHERQPIEFPETISKETNDGWVIYGDKYTGIYASDWTGINGYFAHGTGIDGGKVGAHVYFERRANNTDPQYIRLRKRIYLEKGRKYKIKFNFEIAPNESIDDARTKELIDNGDWTNPFDYVVSMSSDIFGFRLISTNAVGPSNPTYKKLQFDKEGKAENTTYYIPNDNGLMDIEIRPLNGDSVLYAFVDNILVMKITEISIEDLGFKDEEIFTRELPGEWTLKKEQTLDFADDMTAFSKAFRFNKLKDKGTYQVFNFKPEGTLFFESNYYYSVNLDAANLIKENPDVVYSQGQKIDYLEVFYNYKNSQEHVVKVSAPILETAGFDVYVYDAIAEIGDRDYWQQWTDSLYRVEKERYGKAALNILDRLFDKSTSEIQDFNLKNDVKINDLIGFYYKGKKDWILTNCKWNIDTGYSNVSAIENYYAVTPGENIPPVVEAGENIFFEGDTALVTSEAYDPDGFIVSYLWEETTNNGGVIANPITPNLSLTNLTGDFYTFKVTVTDNDGATATDNISLYRIKDVTITLLEINSVDTTDEKRKDYKIVVTPELSEGDSLNIRGQLTVSQQATKADITSSGVNAKIRKNDIYLSDIDLQGGKNRTENLPFSLTYTKGAVIVAELQLIGIVLSNVEAGYTVEYYSKIEIEAAEFVDGNGTALNIPVSAQVIYPG